MLGLPVLDSSRSLYLWGNAHYQKRPIYSDFRICVDLIELETADVEELVDGSSGIQQLTYIDRRYFYRYM